MNKNIKICQTGYSKLYIKHIRYTSVRIKDKKKANKEANDYIVEDKKHTPT